MVSTSWNETVLLQNADGYRCAWVYRSCSVYYWYVVFIFDFQEILFFNWKSETLPKDINLGYPLNIRTPSRVYQLLAGSEEDLNYWVKIREILLLIVNCIFR